MPTATWQLPLLLRRVALLLPLLCLSWLAQAQTSYFNSGSISYQTDDANNRLQPQVRFKVREIISVLTEFRNPVVIGGVRSTSALIDFGDGTPREQVNLTVLSKGQAAGNFNTDYFIGEYNTTHTYSSPGRYFVTVRGENRTTSGGVVLATSAVVGAGTTNDSPVSLPDPLVLLDRTQGTPTYQVPASDPNGDALTYSLATAEEAGDASGRVNPAGLSINPSTGVLSFNTANTAADDFYTAVIKISDGSTLIVVDQLIRLVGTYSLCDPTATAPVAVADQLSTATGSPLTFTAAQLLANDTDPRRRPLQVASVGRASRGQLVTNADGTYTYSPMPGFVGQVSFQYVVQLAGPVVASPATGHYYEFVSAPGISWTAARAAAAARRYEGQQGYLATVTSVAEKNALVGRFPGQYWFGASDAAVEGEWRWQSGPEAGQLFWRGAATGTALGYANWIPNQPDDFKNQYRPAGEDYGQFYGQSGLWNDLDERGVGGRIEGYLVEYGGVEACTLVLFATGTATITVGGTAALNRGLVAPATATAAMAKAGLEAAPNPSAGQFRLRVTAAQPGLAQVELYDLQGRRVKAVFAGELHANEVRELAVDAPELAAGVYVVRLQSGRQVQHLRIAIHK